MCDCRPALGVAITALVGLIIGLVVSGLVCYRAWYRIMGFLDAMELRTNDHTDEAHNTVSHICNSNTAMMVDRIHKLEGELRIAESRLEEGY